MSTPIQNLVIQIKNNHIWALFVDGGIHVTVVNSDLTPVDELVTQLPIELSISDDHEITPLKEPWKQL
jgi:hypothetical protein